MSTKTSTSAREPVGCLGQRRQVVIPREICDKLQLQEGDFVAFARLANGVLIPSGWLIVTTHSRLRKAHNSRRPNNKCARGNSLLWPSSSMNWTVNLAREAEKQLKAIPPDRRERILHDIRELAADPFRGGAATCMPTEPPCVSMRAVPAGENRMLTHGGSVAYSVQHCEAYGRILVKASG